MIEYRTVPDTFSRVIGHDPDLDGTQVQDRAANVGRGRVGRSDADAAPTSYPYAHDYASCHPNHSAHADPALVTWASPPGFSRLAN